MSKIIGNTTATPTPRSDWNQVDETKADYILNKPKLGSLATKDVIDKADLSSDVQTSLGKADVALAEAKVYTDDAVSNTLASAKSYTDIKVADLVDSAPETLDTLGELAAAMAENQEIVDVLNSAITNKADKSDIVDAYSKYEIDNMQFITVEDIDRICGGSIQSAREVTL